MISNPIIKIAATAAALHRTKEHYLPPVAKLTASKKL